MTEPMYQRIAARLRRQIQDGRLKPGDRLPTFPELAAELDVSVMTARNAVMQLVRENLVYTAGSKGTLVRNRRVVDYDATLPLRPDRPQTGSDIWMETARSNGVTGSKTFEMRIEPALPQIAGYLGVDPDDFVVVRTLVQYADDEPWSYEVSYYARDLAEATGIDSPRDIEEGTMRRLRDRGYPEVSWTDLNMARPADEDEAEALEIQPGTYIVDHIRIGATTDRVTRVTRTRRVAGRNRIIHRLGQDEGNEVIQAAINRAEGQQA